MTMTSMIRLASFSRPVARRSNTAVVISSASSSASLRFFSRAKLCPRRLRGALLSRNTSRCCSYCDAALATTRNDYTTTVGGLSSLTPQSRQYYYSTTPAASSVSASFVPTMTAVSSFLRHGQQKNDGTTTTTRRGLSSTSSLTEEVITKRLNDFQDLFVEARLCIDDLKDSIGTSYYEDDFDEAKEAVETAIVHFEAILNDVTDQEARNKILRSNGLKIEQLKGELELTLSDHDDHH